MKLLAVDIGNSKIAAALLEGGRVAHKLVGGQERETIGAEARAAEVYDWCAQQLRLDTGTGGRSRIDVIALVPGDFNLRAGREDLA